MKAEEYIYINDSDKECGEATCKRNDEFHTLLLDKKAEHIKKIVLNLINDKGFNVDEHISFMLCLISMDKNMEISKYIKDNDIENKVNLHYKRIVNKFYANEKVSVSEQTFIENYFIYNINEQKENVILDSIIIATFNGKPPLLKETFKNVLVSVMNNNLRLYCKSFFWR